MLTVFVPQVAGPFAKGALGNVFGRLARQDTKFIDVALVGQRFQFLEKGLDVFFRGIAPVRQRLGSRCALLPPNSPQTLVDPIQCVVHADTDKPRLQFRPRAPSKGRQPLAVIGKQVTSGWLKEKLS